MTFGNKFPQLLMGSAVLFATVIGIISGFTLRNNEINRIYDGQAQLNSALVRLAKNKIEQSQEQDVKQFSDAMKPFKVIRGNAREMSGRINTPQFAPMSFWAFDYFAGKKDEKFSFFYSPQNFPAGEDCALMLGVPEKTIPQFKTFLNSERIRYDRYRCYTDDLGKNFMGFLMDSASGRHVTYLYLERLNTEGKLSFKSLDELIAENMQGFVPKDGSLLQAIWYKGRFIASSADLDESKLGLKPVNHDQILQQEINISDSNYLSTLSCKDGVCVLSALPSDDISWIFVFLPIFSILGALCICAGINELIKRNRQIILSHDQNAVIQVKALESFIKDHELNKKSNPETLENRDILAGTTLNHVVVDAGRKFLQKISDFEQFFKNEMKIAAEKNQIALKDAELDGKAEALKSVQESLMPKDIDLPSSRFLDISSLLLSSKKACTDTYDIFRADKDNLVFTMASCSHKGPDAMHLLPEALILLRKFIRDEGMTPDLAFKEVNKLLIERNHTGAVVSLFTMVLSEFTGNYSCASAGFNAPILSTMSGASAVELSVSRAICENPEEHFFLNKGKIDFGNSMLIFTPGLADLKNKDGASFGCERLGTSLSEKYEGSSRNMVYHVMHELHSFSPESPDEDLCVICVKKTNNAKYID